MTGYEAELHFWRIYLPKRWKKHLRKSQLAGYLIELIEDRKEVDILDVGSGPVSTIGYVLDGVKVNLALSDILADEYAQLLKELNLEPRIKIDKQDMSKMTYDDNTFDIVNCRNALDHSDRPFDAIREMIRVCRVAGWVCLWHFAHVGWGARYRGLHSWNIDTNETYRKFLRGKSPIENEDCLIWNKQDSFLLSECVGGFSTMMTFDSSQRRHVIISKRQKF